jgi:hypothetical protein
MSAQARLGPSIAAVATVAVLIAACSSGGGPPAWTAMPPPSVTPASGPTDAPVPSVPPATPTAAAVPTIDPPALEGITPDELLTLTGGTGSRIDAGTPTPVTRTQAVDLVRARFPGDRPLIWDGLVTYGSDQHLGWMIVLGTAPGQRCPLHAGLLDRALEGGIVDATDGTIGWTYVCG